MLSLAVNSYTTPSNYELLDLPTPELSSPTDVLVKVHAASINPGDVNTAAGATRVMMPLTFPFKIGLDMSGTVVRVGEAVTEFAEGDEVFGILPLTRGGTYLVLFTLHCPSFASLGSVAEYALISSTRLVQKPSSLSHTEAASLPCVAVTALQSLKRANAVIEGGLSGKTVFIPAGLGGTGSIAVQLAKRVYGAGKVITTVSTSKIGKMDEFLGAGVVDQVIDYTKEDVLQVVEKGSVDFFYDTAGVSMQFISVMKKGGLVISITTMPSGKEVAKVMPDAPYSILRVLDVLDWVNQWRFWWWGARLEARVETVDTSGVAQVSQLAEGGKVKAVVGRTADLDDLQGIRDACTEIKAGKGGLGKFVVVMSKGQIQ
jgi:NADPH:quinone reductase-like Zn-dependent oxidoreductase